MSEKMISLLAACAITAAGLAISAPAVAQQTEVVTATITEDTPVRYVSYRDLNLARPEGEQRLFTRVKYAVHGVCAESMAGELMVRSEEFSCRNESLTRAQPQINRAVQRARDIAATGWSSIAPVAITISVP